MKHEMIASAASRSACLLALLPILYAGPLKAHEGHSATTYKVTDAWEPDSPGSALRLSIEDESGKRIAARFTLTVDGEPYVPDRVNAAGLRFVSIHLGKRNTFIATFARGTGDVLIPLPPGKAGTVTVARGFEYRAATQAFDVIDNAVTDCTVVMRRWANLSRQGWATTDEHVHYERQRPEYDTDWLTMLDADGLNHAHFMVLKGGNVPGIWAEQYAYGDPGEGRRDDQFVRSGEEYRDSAQGHINLLGLETLIEPISTGGIGRSPRYNNPPLADVLQETRRRGGMGGPAHGGALAKSSTAVLDTVLGRVDFFEIANSHLYKTDVWYSLLNAGFVVPPVAGTDLPNFGFRDPWQPLFGEVRTYVRMGETRGFDAWADAVRRGETFVTSGPLIQFTVNGRGPGATVSLPEGGGEITVAAELSSPRELRSLEVVRTGEVIPVETAQTVTDGINRWRIETKLTINESCWIAARGTGGPKTAIERGLKIEQSEIAHTAPIKIIVGEKPIGNAVDRDALRTRLIAQQQYYRSEGRFESSEARKHMMQLFEQAIDTIRD